MKDNYGTAECRVLHNYGGQDYQCQQQGATDYCISLCYDELQADEKFVTFYQLDTTDTKTIVTVLKNVILALNLDIHRHRGQCYDRASRMSGVKSGIAKQILEEEPMHITHITMIMP